MGILDKAKEATGAVSEKASALKERATSAASDLSEQASAKAGAIFDAGFGQVTQAVADFNAALPIVREAGYTLGGVSVEVSLSPKISASFTTAELITDEQASAIAEKHADNKLAVMLIKTLRRGGKLQQAMSVGGLRPLGLQIGIGLSPSISIQFG